MLNAQLCIFSIVLLTRNKSSESYNFGVWEEFLRKSKVAKTGFNDFSHKGHPKSSLGQAPSTEKTSKTKRHEELGPRLRHTGMTVCAECDTKLVFDG